MPVLVKDIPVYTSIYRYILGTYTVKHLLYSESGFACLATPMFLCRTLLACFARCDLPLECLLNTQTTQAGNTTRAKLHSHRLTSHRHRCPAFRQQELRRRSHTGSLNPCACWTCVGSSESSFLLEKGTKGETPTTRFLVGTFSAVQLSTCILGTRGVQRE